MRSLYSLSLRNLAARRLRTLLTGVAITLGVAAVFATSLLGQSAQVRTAEVARRGSRAALQITSRHGDAYEAGVLEAVLAHPDVALTSPEVEHNTVLLDPAGVPLMLLGVDPAVYGEMEQITLLSGRYPTAARRPWIVLPQRWAEEYDVGVGARLTIPPDDDSSEPVQLRVGSFRYEQGNYETAVRILRQGRGVLIMPATARRLGLGVGDEIVLKTKRGRVPFRVAAVGGNPWFGTIVSHADAERYFGVWPPLGYMITAKRGADGGEIEARLREAMEGQRGYTFFEIGRGSKAIDVAVGRPLRALAALFNGVTLLALIIASLGQINTVTVSVMARVRELGVLRAVGMTPGQVRGLVLVEAAGVGVVGAVVGIVAGMGAVLMYTLAWYTSAAEATGFGSPTWASVSESVGSAWRGVGPISALALAAAPLLTALAAWGPAGRAASRPIIEAIRHEAAALGR